MVSLDAVAVNNVVCLVALYLPAWLTPVSCPQEPFNSLQIALPVDNSLFISAAGHPNVSSNSSSEAHLYASGDRCLPCS